MSCARGLFCFLSILFCFHSAKATDLQIHWIDKIEQLKANEKEGHRIEHSKILKGYHVLFIAGFLNEFIRGYFTENIQAIEDLGGEASKIEPSSKNDFIANATAINTTINELLKTGKKVIVVGHSLGGAGVFETVFQFPETAKKVELFITVQAALGGSEVATIVDKIAPECLLSEETKKGTKCLVPEKTTNTLLAEFKKFKKNVPDLATQKALSRKILEIQSFDTEANMGILGLTHGYLSNRAQKKNRVNLNDGLVLVEDQIFPEFGTPYAIVHANHAALFAAGPLSSLKVVENIKTPPDFKARAFTYALFEDLFLEKKLNQAQQDPQPQVQGLLEPIGIEAVQAPSDSDEKACKSSKIPEVVLPLRGKRSTYNAKFQFFVRHGHICFKAAGDEKAPWKAMAVPRALYGKVHSISVDSSHLYAVRKGDNQLYKMKKALDDPSDFEPKWQKEWGHPFGYGDGVKLPADTYVWDGSQLSTKEDKYYVDTDKRPHTIGVGCTTVYAVRGNRQQINYYDPWLPVDNSYEVCGPKRGKTKIEALSTSGSSLFVMNQKGDLFTRRYDFDMVGADKLFILYTFNEHHHHPQWAILEKLFTKRKLPLPDWVMLPKITEGDVTNWISIEKEGEGARLRRYKVEGKKGGKTGYFEAFYDFVTADLSQVVWKFIQTDHRLKGKMIANYNAADTSDSDLGLNDDQAYSGSSKYGDLLLEDFNPHCSPAKFQVKFKSGETLDLNLHSFETIRLSRRGEHSKKELKLYGAIEVPKETLDIRKTLGKASQKFIDDVLKNKQFRKVNLTYGDDQVKISRGLHRPWILKLGQDQSRNLSKDKGQQQQQQQPALREIESM